MIEPGHVYPAPTLILGMGRFGLATLERLGEDWQQLKLSGADLSLRNLRLLWLHPEPDEEEAFRRQERKDFKIANYIGDGDLPSLVLDFVILRTLGLVRFRQGTYQVAIPRDAGVVRASDLRLDGSVAEPAAGPAVDPPPGATEQSGLVRRRFFQWSDLTPDPVTSAEELKRRAEASGQLDLFTSPIINRVRQGHTPQGLLACIARCHALTQGRDPSPWKWVAEEIEDLGSPDGDRRILGENLRRLQARPQSETGLLPEDWLLDGPDTPGPSELYGDGFVPYPLKGWKSLRSDWGTGTKGAGVYGAGAVAEAEDDNDNDDIHVPAVFVPQPGDPRAPVDPFELLREDWETTGWATEGIVDERRDPFTPLPVTRFRLGLFDHDVGRPGNDAAQSQFRRRLQCMADLLHRGLIRLWVDLNRDRVEERAPTPGVRRQEKLDPALKQSLEVLRELLVKPLEDSDDPAFEVGSRPSQPQTLPAQPTELLRAAAVDRDPGQLEDLALERRLASLGLEDPEAQELQGPRPLFNELCLDPPPEDRPDGPHCDDGEADPAAREEWIALRQKLNEEVRDLLGFSFLTAYRKRPTRQPPRLTVFVVGDMSEPFVRVRMQSVLREIHSELLRSFSPMFEIHREGFDRALSVVPIIWMPHPADPFGGACLKHRRPEEAAIIDAVHRVRRWVESVLPTARRRISQIFVNGRVTDTSVLSLGDCVGQTRDFISFQIRNDLSQDDWLRRTAVGPGGDDFFSSFACYEIEFPAERAREYLANRLARDCLGDLVGNTRAGKVDGAETDDGHLPTAPRREELVAAPSHELKELTGPGAKAVEDAVKRRLDLSWKTPYAQIRESFNEGFEAELWRTITTLWQELSDRRGRMDDLIDQLRHSISVALAGALSEFRNANDSLITASSTAAGLNRAFARLGLGRAASHRRLQDCESERREWQRHCDHHRIPKRDPLRRARGSLLDTARSKPDFGPSRVGLLIWLLMAPASGAALHGYLYSYLGAWATLAGSVLLGAVAWAALDGYSRFLAKKIRRAVERLAEASRQIVAGAEGDLRHQPPSIRSFFDTRVNLTAALACRGYAMQVYEQAVMDENLAHRLRESLDIQAHLMLRRAQALGVRPAMTDSGATDDLRSLFVSRSGEKAEKLIEPVSLLEYYERRIQPSETQALPVDKFLDAAGGFGNWRKTACLSHTERIMDFGRQMFDSLLQLPITDLDYFAAKVGKNLYEFVGSRYSNMGFGAKFIGYEGLDPDGVRLVADAALVADQSLQTAYKNAEEKRTTPHAKSLKRYTYKVRPNAAYMLSMVQGVRAHSVHNLRRFESFHDRPLVPGDGGSSLALNHSRAPSPIHHLTGYEGWANELYRRVREAAQAARMDPGEGNGAKVRGEGLEDRHG